MAVRKHFGLALLAGTALFGVALSGAVAPAALSAQQPSASAQPEVTFTKDIAPILQRSCQNCHRPGQVAPMSLLTYEEARPWARSMKQRTALRDKAGVMPPWYIEKNIGIQHYKNDPSLSDDEIAKIAKWADTGAPRGDVKDMPAARVFNDTVGWHAGEPDLIIESPGDHRQGEHARLVGRVPADQGAADRRPLREVGRNSRSQQLQQRVGPPDGRTALCVAPPDLGHRGG